MKLKHELLEFIKNIPDALPGLLETKQAHIRRLRGYPKNFSQKSFYTTLKRMEKDKLIKKPVNSRGLNSYVITTEGEKALVRNKKLKRRTDEFLTLVVFDIPEEKRRARDTFRRFMLKNGFNILQKSVLIGPFEFSRYCETLVKDLEIDKYVTICSVKVDNFSFN